MVIFINSNYIIMDLSPLSYDEQLKEAIRRSNTDKKYQETYELQLRKAISRSKMDENPKFIPSDEKRNFLLESYEEVCKEKDNLFISNCALKDELKKLLKKVKLLQEENKQLRNKMTNVVLVEDVQVVS